MIAIFAISLVRRRGNAAPSALNCSSGSPFLPPLPQKEHRWRLLSRPQNNMNTVAHIFWFHVLIGRGCQDDVAALRVAVGLPQRRVTDPDILLLFLNFSKGLAVSGLELKGNKPLSPNAR